MPKFCSGKAHSYTSFWETRTIVYNRSDYFGRCSGKRTSYCTDTYNLFCRTRHLAKLVDNLHPIGGFDSERVDVAGVIAVQYEVFTRAVPRTLSNGKRPDAIQD